MGSACCVAAKDRHDSQGSGFGGSQHRNVLFSPSWSFRWENRRRVADEAAESPHQVYQGGSRNISVEGKTSIGSERVFSDEGSPLENTGTATPHKSPLCEELASNAATPPSDFSLTSSCSREVKSLVESPNFGYSMTQPSMSVPVSGPSAHGQLLPPKSLPSRQACRSPGHQLFRQVSDSRILGLKSPDHPFSEGRSSFVLSSCSNDLMIGSLGGSSDCWSMQTFSELVASQRERWSFESEHLGSMTQNVSSTRFSCSSHEENHSCGACSKLLQESYSCSGGNDPPITSVLACGHAYHADCLDLLSLESDRYDPACPICAVGQKKVLKLSRKAWKTEAERKAKLHKRSRNRVIDSFLDDRDGDIILEKKAKREGKLLKMDPTPHLRHTFAKPFLKRHFSIGTRANKHLERDYAPKKSFWAKYRDG